MANSTNVQLRVQWFSRGIGNAKRSLTGDVTGLVHAERKLYKAPGSNMMQSLLRAGPSFRLRRNVAAYIQKYANGRTKFKLASSRFPFSKNAFSFVIFSYYIISLKITCSFIFNPFYLHSRFFARWIFNIPSTVQFPRRFKFFRKRVNFLLPASPLLPFLQRNTLTCKLDFLVHIDIERKSCIVISHVDMWDLGIRYTKEIDLHACLTKLKLPRWLDTSNADNIATYITALATDPWISHRVDKKYTSFPLNIKLPFSSLFVPIYLDPRRTLR